MPNTFVVSDWHLHHRNILRYCPHRLDLWPGVEEMNVGLLEAALDTVAEGDRLYFLGDLTFQIGSCRDRVLESLRPLADRLGEFHWIVGNHDEPDRMPDVAALFDSVVHAAQFRVGPRHVFLSHYPVEVAHRDLLRLVSIHGHHHGTIHNPLGRIDVSVDSLYGIREQFNPAYRGEPISLETALALADVDIAAPFESEGQPEN
ncbi:MAG: calcineurin-like phosphoesterase family protein [Rhodothermales bacterium]|jgi:calcineurin-like phosphoesterase family protein